MQKIRGIPTASLLQIDRHRRLRKKVIPRKMERKRALERSPPATFSSNEQWFIGKLGRDVWKHEVLEFLLPSRRTQFRKAWFQGAIFYELATTLSRLAHSGTTIEYHWMLWGIQRTTILFCTRMRCRRGAELTGTNLYPILVHAKAIDTEDYVRKLFPGRWDESVPWKGRLPRLSLQTNSGSLESSVATSGNTKF